jgi:putative ABC transport system permease protein
MNPDEIQKLSVKIQSGNLPGVITEIDRSWNVMTDLPFDYSFLDQNFDELYKRENQLSKFVAIFSGLAILVACLGLIGLVSFSIKKRFREIGIRKVLGSSVMGILSLLSKESIRLILLSFFIAVPLAYYLTWLWLQNFIDRIVIQPLAFIIAGSSVLAVAMVVICAFSLRMARTNPVDALRNE